MSNTHKLNIHNHYISPCSVSDEKQLSRVLLDRYADIGKSGRPVINTSTPVEVSFVIGLVQLEVKETENLLELTVWLKMVRTCMIVFEVDKTILYAKQQYKLLHVLYMYKFALSRGF